MRIRSIKPEFFKHDVLCGLQPLARLLFEGLWCMSDRRGRLEDRPKRIKTEVLPYDRCSVESLLTLLANAGFIIRYEASGMQLIQIVAFEEHQRITGKEAETESKFPGPPSGKHPGNNGETTETTEGKGREGKGENLPRGFPSNTPPSLQTPEFTAAWRDFEQHLDSLRVKVSEKMRAGWIHRMTTEGPERAIAVMRGTIDKGGKYPYWDFDSHRGNGSPTPKPTAPIRSASDAYGS